MRLCAHRAVFYFRYTNMRALRSLLQTQTVFTASLWAFFIGIAVFRLWNSWHFNPYWGYDGGEHINYLFSLIHHGQIPSINENTIAWHEPLYYFLLWPIGKAVYILSDGSDLAVLKSFGVVQALLSVAVSVVLYAMLRRISSSQWTALLVTALVSLLPPFNQASTFLTNELLNYFFIFLLIHYFITHFLRAHPQRRHYAWLGLIAGVALITKITALIAVMAMGGICIVRALRGQPVDGVGILIGIVVIAAINAPWLLYKRSVVIDSFSINNTDFLQPQPLTLDDRVTFFLRFDADIFTFPYWYSGGRAFWSMLMADSFYDYYGSVENKNLITQLARDPSSDALVRTTHTPTFVTKHHYAIARFQSYAAVVLSAFLMVGLGGLVYRAVGRGMSEEYLFYSIFSLGFLAALMYFAYRYPYYDHGIVKSIFILPFYVFPLWYFFEWIRRYRFIAAGAITFVFVYLGSILYYYWVTPFGY